MRYTWENDNLAFENISTSHQIGKKTPFEKMRNKKAFQSNANCPLADRRTGYIVNTLNMSGEGGGGLCMVKRA